MLIKITHRDDAGSSGVNPDFVTRVQAAGRGGASIHMKDGTYITTGRGVDETIADLNEPEGGTAQAIQWLSTSIDGLARAIMNHS